MPPTTPADTSETVQKERELAWWSFRRLRTLLRNDARRHKVLFGAGLATLGIVSTLAYLTYRRPYLPLDLATTLNLQRIHLDVFADSMVAISLVGYNPWSLLLVVGGSIAVGYRLTWKAGLFLLGLTTFQGLVNWGIKAAISRPRPTEDVVNVLLSNTGFSFPSGHVMLYTVFFGFLFFLIWVYMPKSFIRALLLAVAGTFILFVGPSRIYLGAHWLSDVFAAYLLSIIILLFGIEFYIKYVMQRT